MQDGSPGIKSRLKPAWIRLINFENCEISNLRFNHQGVETEKSVGSKEEL